MATRYINWDTLKNTQKYLSMHHQFFIIKHAAGILATGRNTRRRQKRDCDRCPQCGAQDEHGMHIVQCAHKHSSNTFLMTFVELCIWLTKTTSSQIESAITNLVLELQNGTSIETTYRSNISGAVETQKAIGIYPLICVF